MQSEAHVYKQLPGAELLRFPDNKMTPVAVKRNKGVTTALRILCASRKFFVSNYRGSDELRVFNRLNADTADLPDLKGEVLCVAFPGGEANMFACSVAVGEILVVRIDENAQERMDLRVIRRIPVLTPWTKLAWMQAPGTTHQHTEPLEGKLLYGVDQRGDVFVWTSETEGPSPLSGVARLQKAAESSCLSLKKNILALADGCGTVSIIQLPSAKPLLAQSWLPHDGNEVTALRVVIPEGSSNVHIITASNQNAEIRIWSVNGSVAHLNQQITLESETDAGRRVLETDAAGSHLLIASPNSSAVIVMELIEDNGSLLARRVSEWDITEPVVAFASITRKVTTAGAATSRTEQIIIAETLSRIVYATLDDEKLRSAATIGSASAPPPRDSVMKWFGKGEPAAPPPPAAQPSVFKEVTSTLGGGNAGATANASVVERQAQEALKHHMGHVRATMDHIDSHLQRIQQQAVSNMNQYKNMSHEVLQRAERDARAVTNSLLRNVEVGVQKALRQRFDEQVELEPLLLATDKMTREATRTACNAAVKDSSIATTVDRSWESIQRDLSNIIVPKARNNPNIDAFIRTLDGQLSQQHEAILLESGKFKTFAQSMVKNTDETSVAAIRQAQRLIDSLKEELTGLKSDLGRACSQPQQASAAPAFSKENAIRLATSGLWNEAFCYVLDAADVHTTMSFLELDVVRNNRDAVVDPKTLQFPVFTALVQQLTHELRSSMGQIPMKVEWLHDLLVSWEDHLHALRRDKNTASQYGSLEPIFATASAQLTTLNKGEVDSATLRQIKIVNKILNR